MGRYLLKFSKENNLKYISHLDLLRVFQRAFKRAHIRLRYSQGFNPHAKIGFGQPLSLGSESTGEYLTALSGCMPDGIRLLSCTKLKEEGKTSLAAAVAYASYVVKFRGDDEERQVLSRRLKEYISRESILCEKMNKKKKIVETDIRPLILSFSEVKADGGQNIYSMTLKTGSGGNLNPEMLVKSFCVFCGVEYLRHRWDYRRTEMYFISGERGEIQPLTEFSG